MARGTALLRKAVVMGNVEAGVQLSTMQPAGKETSLLLKKAVAANYTADDGQSMYNYARRMARGEHGVPQDEVGALALYSKAAACGQHTALFNAGNMHRDGRTGPGGRPDFPAALALYLQCAATDAPCYPDACMEAAELLLWKAGLPATASTYTFMPAPPVPVDVPRAVQLLERAAEAGKVEAAATLGSLLAFTQAAPQEHAQHPMPPDGTPRGIYWLRRAAAMGDKGAHGMLTANGFGLEGWPPKGATGFVRNSRGDLVKR